jgi:hypothetical protein
LCRLAISAVRSGPYIGDVLLDVASPRHAFADDVEHRQHARLHTIDHETFEIFKIMPA